MKILQSNLVGEELLTYSMDRAKDAVEKLTGEKVTAKH
jgi:hypothetical protein